MSDGSLVPAYPASTAIEGLPRSALKRLQLSAYARFWLRPHKIGNLPRVAHLSAIPVALGHAIAGQLAALAG